MQYVGRQFLVFRYQPPQHLFVDRVGAVAVGQPAERVGPDGRVDTGLKHYLIRQRPQFLGQVLANAPGDLFHVRAQEFVGVGMLEHLLDGEVLAHRAVHVVTEPDCVLV